MPVRKFDFVSTFFHKIIAEQIFRYKGFRKTSLQSFRGTSSLSVCVCFDILGTFVDKGLRPCQFEKLKDFFKKITINAKILAIIVILNLFQNLYIKDPETSSG